MEDIQKQLLIAKGTAIGKNFSEKTVTRTPFTLDDIKEVTDMCQLSTAAAGAREWNSKHPDRPIHENTVLKYVNHFKTYKTYFQPETRGPKHLLSHDQEDILVAVLKQWRANGNAIIATLVSAIAAGRTKRSMRVVRLLSSRKAKMKKKILAKWLRWKHRLRKADQQKLGESRYLPTYLRVW